VGGVSEEVAAAPRGGGAGGTGGGVRIVAGSTSSFARCSSDGKGAQPPSIWAVSKL
jgi:hypothetical protein